VNERFSTIFNAIATNKAGNQSFSCGVSMILSLIREDWIVAISDGLRRCWRAPQKPPTYDNRVLSALTSNGSTEYGVMTEFNKR